MPSKNPAQRLRDILENIDLIGEFTRGLAYGGFARDTKTVYAVVRALEIVSEATKRLPPELKARYPEIDWTAISASGNVYRHEYEGVDESPNLVHRAERHRSPETNGDYGIEILRSG